MSCRATELESIHFLPAGFVPRLRRMRLDILGRLGARVRDATSAVGGDCFTCAF